MSDLIERLEEVAETLEGSSYDWNHERAAMIREAIAEIKRLREIASDSASLLRETRRHQSLSEVKSFWRRVDEVLKRIQSPAPSRPDPEQGE